jgi:hypothetical protein
MSNLTTSNHTLEFLNLICQYCNQSGTIDIKNISTDELEKLESSSESTVVESIKNIGAIGDLLFWSYQLDEPPIESTDQIGVLLRSLSDLLLKADFVRSEAVYSLSNVKA